ncbi:MAG: sigma-70 family RNA polymerase sigma factor [Candidatus Binataceae bacterium]
MAEEQKPELAGNELVRAMAAGNPEALRALNLRYGGMLHAFVLRILRDQSDAEEIVADVLWQAWRDAGSFDSSRGSLTTWLIMLARSRSIDRLREKKAREPGSEITASPPPTAADPATDADLAERARLIRAALAQLDPREKSALELAYYSDLSQSQIADKLGVPLGTVKTRIRTAMSKLRDALSEYRRP